MQKGENKNYQYSGELLELFNDIAYGLHSSYENYKTRLTSGAIYSGTFYIGVLENKIIAIMEDEEDKPSRREIEFHFFKHCIEDIKTLRNTKWDSVQQLQDWLKSLKHYPHISSASCNMYEELKKQGLLGKILDCQMINICNN